MECAGSQALLWGARPSPCLKSPCAHHPSNEKPTSVVPGCTKPYNMSVSLSREKQVDLELISSQTARPGKAEPSAWMGWTLGAGIFAPQTLVSAIAPCRRLNPKLFQICIWNSRNCLSRLGPMPEKRLGERTLWPVGSDLASPPRPAAFPPRDSPATQTPEKCSPTSHLFWQKQLERQRSCASRCRRDAVSSPCLGAAFHSKRRHAGACERSYQQIAGLQPGNGDRGSAPEGMSQSQDQQTFNAILSRQLPELRREECQPPLRRLPRARAGMRDRPGSRSRNHGDGGGADGGRRCGPLPSAGGNGSSQPAVRLPVTLQRRFKETTGQVLPLLLTESDSSH